MLANLDSSFLHLPCSQRTHVVNLINCHVNKVNNDAKPDCHLLPCIEDCVDHVRSAALVTKSDLLKGYWQVSLTQRAREIGMFITPDKFLQYTVMPFGVRNVAATFQQVSHCVLWGVPGCEAYLDDIVFYSAT